VSRQSTVLIVCDHLFEYDLQAKMVNFFCEKFERADICTIGFNTQRALPAFENKKIFSTYIASCIKNKKSFKKVEYLHPWAINSIKIEEDVEMVISISTGYAHLIKVPKKCKHICYFLDEKSELSEISKLFWNKTLNNKKINSLDNVDKLVFSSNQIQKKILNKESLRSKTHIIPPFFDHDEFIYRSDEHKQTVLLKEKKKILINLNEVPKSVFKSIVNLKLDKYEFIYTGDSINLSNLRGLKEFLMIEDKLQADLCDGLISSVFHDCFCYLNFENDYFPENILKAFTIGLPVISFNEKIIDNSFLKDCDIQSCVYSKKNLIQSLKNLEQMYEYDEFSKRLNKFKRKALCYNKRVFHNRFEQVFN
jgi:hypothetical protein